MLDEYPIDPAFNKNLVFAYQPPPEIDAAKLPSLAKNWLESLQEIICQSDSKLPKNIFDKHLGKASAYRSKLLLLKQLELIYHRLQGNLDSELGELSNDRHQTIISKLSEEINHCSEGFHNRVNVIVDSFLKPRNLAELLYTVRKQLVDEVAVILTNEVHAWNRVSVIAANDGIGVKANFPDDTYSGTLSVTFIRKKLQATFQNNFTPFRLPYLLTAAFMEFIPELEREKHAEYGICLQTQDKIKTLLKLFLPNFINEKPNDPNNWKHYFIACPNEKDPLIFSFVNLNWEKIAQSFYLALSDQNYFTTPQIHTLIDSAYYNFYVTKKLNDGSNGLISTMLQEKRYSDLLEQLVEVNTRFPNYYQTRISNNKVFINYSFIEHLEQQLKISDTYSEKIMQGFQLILCLDLRRKNFIIEKIANIFLVKNKAGFNLLMLAAQHKPILANDILVFLKTNKAIINSELIEKIFLMKNKDNSNALMIAASKQTEAIVSILGFLTTHISRFANETLRKLFTQQQKDSYTAVSLTARNHPDRMKNILSFITDHIKIDGETLRKLLFSESSNGACTALMLAAKNQTDATESILNFISKNIKGFDRENLMTMFSEKDQDGFTILMLAARYQPKALEFLFKFINHNIKFFNKEILPTLFLEKDPENNNCLMLATEFNPLSVPIMLNFITDSIGSFKPYLKNILFAKNINGYNSLILARHYPQILESLINFINTQAHGMLSQTLQEIFLEKHKSGFTLFMYTARAQAESLNFIVKFMEKHIEGNSEGHAEFFTQKNLLRLIIEKNELEYNSLMLAAENQPEGVDYLLNLIERHPNIFSVSLVEQLLLAHGKNKTSTLMIAVRYQPEAVKLYLDFIQKHAEIFSTCFLHNLLLASDQYGVNALMTAATYQTHVVKLLLDFLARNIMRFDSDEIYEFVFKKIHDKAAAMAVFFGGRYNFRKSILSVTAQLKDSTAINALLNFVDEHIELIGMETLTELLTEKDNDDNYIFQPACCRYPYTMKNVLNFIANPENSKDLVPIPKKPNPLQEASADFIFQQFASWSIKTDEDNKLLNKVILNCSALLLIYFNKDYFVEQPNNLKVVTDQLLDCYIKEPDISKNQYPVFTYNFYFFKSYISPDEQNIAAQSLKKQVSSDDKFNLENLKRLKAKHRVLTSLRSQDSANLPGRLSNLFSTYCAIAKPAKIIRFDASNSLVENNSAHFP